MSLHRAYERAVIARLEIDLIKTVYKGRLGMMHGGMHLSGDVELLLIAAVVVVGHAAMAPKNSAEISRILGIPRVTVDRKLRALTHRGIVERLDGRRYIMTEKKPSESFQYVDDAVSLIKHAARKLEVFPS
jgi:Sugar-specific transcriptional regulator TrmB